MALYWLVQGCQPGDSLLFHYSGHGSRQRNYNGDEVDGYDETLCPLDFETQGMIVDDEINATIVRPLPHGVKLHAIIDACHSGTILDLPFLCRMSRLVSCTLVLKSNICFIITWWVKNCIWMHLEPAWYPSMWWDEFLFVLKESWGSTVLQSFLHIFLRTFQIL